MVAPRWLTTENATPQLVMTNRVSLGFQCPVGWKAICLHAFPGISCSRLWKICCRLWLSWHSLSGGSGLFFCHGLGLPTRFLYILPSLLESSSLCTPAKPTWLGAFVNYWFTVIYSKHGDNIISLAGSLKLHVYRFQTLNDGLLERRWWDRL